MKLQLFHERYYFIATLTIKNMQQQNTCKTLRVSFNMEKALSIQSSTRDDADNIKATKQRNGRTKASAKSNIFINCLACNFTTIKDKKKRQKFTQYYPENFISKSNTHVAYCHMGITFSACT